MEALISYVQNEFIEKKDFPEFSSGDTLTVYYQIREGEKVRTQFFKGTVIQIKGQGLSKTFTIRKMSRTFGVDRIFPMNLPTLEKIEVNKKLIGKTVKVLGSGKEWTGQVVGVEDENTFSVTNGKELVYVDIFDIRSLD